MNSIDDLAARLANGETSSRDLVEEALERIATADGEGARAFVFLDDADARAQADRADQERKSNRARSPLAGIPISVKDLFDVQGQVTRAGSKVLDGTRPAPRDATAIGRLRDAGLVILGRTNMTEFAYSGLGLNPHYPAPRAPFERDVGSGRIPGGSSSGAAVSVSDGIVAVGIGTDTGGSCRIPAAFCGIVGYKPTAQRIELDGAYPLSKSLDSIGPLARTVACCARIDSIMANEAYTPPSPRNLSDLKLGVLRNYALDDMDDEVASAFEESLRRLGELGAELIDIEISELDRLPALNARGGIVAAEAYQVHQDLIAKQGDDYDPRVVVRILKAKEQQPDEYVALLSARAEIIAAANARTDGLDGVLMPTVPIIPPRFSELEDEAEYGRINLLALRNPTVANFLDRCAISMPLPTSSSAPVGLMLMGETMADQDLFAVAAGLERAIGN